MENTLCPKLTLLNTLSFKTYDNILILKLDQVKYYHIELKH